MSESHAKEAVPEATTEPFVAEGDGEEAGTRRAAWVLYARRWLPGLALLALGLFSVREAVQLGLGSSQQPGSGFPRHHDRLQGGRTPLVAHRQPDDLLGESGLRAGRFSQYSRRTDRSIRTGRPPTASSAICRV